MGQHNYHIQSDPIGVGAYGAVYKGFSKTDSSDVVALKRTKIENFNDGIPSTTMREISILNELDHENIVKLKNVIQTRDYIWFVQEFCNIDLSKLLRDSVGPLSAQIIRLLMRQLLEGVRYMHESRIMHRDLKPPNLLLTGPNNDRLKIADFGLARAFSIPIKPYTKEVVTLYYRAPELLLKMHEYATPVDIWSVGCIFAELALKRQLFQG